MIRAKGKVASRNASGFSVGRILVPLDFSPASKFALESAISLAKLTGAKIILLHVVESVYTVAEPSMTMMPEVATMEAGDDGKRLLAVAKEAVPPALFESVVVRAGTPFHEITMAAQKLKVDLIVITTHGRTGLSHVLLGSTAERVVQHAHCPVLTLRQPKVGRRK